MKRTSFFSALGIFCLICITASCAKEAQYIEAVKLTNDLYIVETDTLTPLFMVYRLDSFQTSGSAAALIGAHTDPAFGAFMAKSYSAFNISTVSYDNVGASSESFDSIALVMRLNKNYYGDTSALFSLTVNQLLENIDGANSIYYNLHQLSANPSAIGSISAALRPNVDDSIRIPLSVQFGKDLFELYRQKDARITTNDNFHQYFKGLQIGPASGNQAIFGFNPSDSATYIRLYYHDDQGTRIPKFIDFLSQGGAYHYNHITYDPSDGPLAALMRGKEMSSSSLDNKFYVNDLAGIGTKITFPSAKELPRIENYVRLAAADLQLRPVDGSFQRYPLIPYMALGISNEVSTTPSPLYTLDNTALQNGNLSIDLLNGQDTYYSYDMTAFLRAEFVSTIFTTSAITLLPYTSQNSRGFSMQRLIGSDGAGVSHPTKLHCQLLFYKK